MYPIPFTTKVHPKESPEPHDESPQKISSPTDGANESDAATTKAINVLSKPSPAAFQPDQLEDSKPAPACHPPEMSSQAAAAVSAMSNSFARTQGFTGNFNPQFPVDPQFSMASDASLMVQPLITTPGGMQLSELLGSERRSEYRHVFTPRPIAQRGLHPAQSSVITNRTYRSNTPAPFPPSLLRSTSRTYSYGHPSVGRDSMSSFSFAGFTPLIQAPPSAAGAYQQQQMPTPSPLYALSSKQVAALGCITSRHNNSRPTTTPVPAYKYRPKKSDEAVVKANKSKKKKAKPSQRSQQVNSSTVMSMDVSSQPCKCPKNQCIKLYCDCFHRGQICDPSECSCTKCLNTAEESTPTGMRTKRVKQILARKGVDAFKVKPKKTGVGCSCKKSRCLKKYCDCVQLGNFCDPQKCICVNCQNLDGTKEASEPQAASKESVPLAASRQVPTASKHDVKVFIDVTNASYESTTV